jgi:peptide/nickel transport system ATP-binding protein
MSGVLVEIRDLALTRPGADRPGLERFSLSLQRAEIVTLLGEADSGKDLLLRYLDGSERCDGALGSVRFGEGEVLPAGRRTGLPFRAAYLPPARPLPLSPRASAASQLSRIVARKLECPRGAAREDLRAALARIEGAPPFDQFRRPAESLSDAALSFGLLAAALAIAPELVLCDHFFDGLSPASAAALCSALRAERARLGFAILYAASGPQAVARLGGRAIVLRQGRIVEEGDAEHLMSGQTHAYTRSLFGALPQPLSPAPQRPTPRGEPLLQVYGLLLQSGGRKAPKAPSRHALNFELRRGASLALLGEEGSGRGARMRAVLGLERRPGRIVFDAVDIGLLSETMMLRLRRRVAIVTGADDALDPRMSLFDTVDEPLRAHLRLSEDLAAGYRETALKRVGLHAYDGRAPVSSLSPFDRRRLQIARAIVAAPLLVVVDEPLRGLDAIAQTTIRDLLAEFRVEQQAAFLVITSDFAIAQVLADEAMVFSEGKLAERGQIRSLLSAPKTEATRALIAAAARRPLSPAAAPV